MGTVNSRLREPMIRYAAMIRALHPRPSLTLTRKSDKTTTDVTLDHKWLYRIPEMDNVLNQAPYRSPSVFNFYLPELRPPGDIQNHVTSKENPPPWRVLLHIPPIVVVQDPSPNKGVQKRLRTPAWIRHGSHPVNRPRRSVPRPGNWARTSRR